MPYIYWPIGLHLSKAKAIVLVRIISEVRVYILDVIRDRVQIAHLQLGLFPKLSVRKFAKLPSSRNQCTYVVLYKILDLLTHRNVYLKSKKENFRFVHWSNDFFSYFSALWLFWDLYSVKISGFFKHSDFTWNYFFAILGGSEFCKFGISALKSAKIHKCQNSDPLNVFTW